MRAFLLSAALLAPAVLALVAGAASAAPCEVGLQTTCHASSGTCAYDASVDLATSPSFDVASDCYSGITRCHTEVSGGQSEPINVDRWCAF